MDAVKNIILTTPEEALEKVLSPFIREQFPAFMREDYGKLILVIKAYYEWMEQHGNVGGVISRLDTVYDLDANADQFYEHFKNTYLLSFPEMFAQDTSGNKPNKKTLLKKIREFYGSKGTESAYKFLFKILYDSDVEFYYPKTDVIKASDGQWIEPKSVKTTLNNGDALFAAKGGRITQVRDEQTTGSAFVESVVQYTLNGLPICEFFLSDIVGDCVPELPVIITKPDGGELKEVVYSVLGQFFVELPGKGYRVGDTVSVIEPVGGSGFSAKVDQIGLAGSIKKLAITNSGVNYSADVLLNIFNEQGNRSAKVIALRGAVTNYPGYFSGNRGKVSSDKKIFDGHYYQDFSYELKSVTSFDTYFSVLKKLVHPAGMRMFGSILLKDEIDNLVSTSTQASFSKTPVIGKYTPYSLRTYNNLRNGIFLPNQVRGVTLQVWLSTHNVLGNTGDGVTADRTQLGSTAELALGVRRIYDISNGLMYQSPATPNETFWTVPRIKEGAVNTHPSLVFRPQNNSGSDLSGTSNIEWRSYGYWSGLTVGALNLFSSHSYFVVAKARLPLSQVATPTVARHLLGDLGGHHGIVVGSGSNPNRTAVVAYVYSTPTSLHQVEAFVPNNSEWFLVSSTQGRTPNVNGSLALFLNGVCAGIVTAPKPTQLFTGNSGKGWTLGIGMRTADEFSTFDGEIAEVVCFQGDVSEADRQKVEGYLAHKYGLSEKLPSNHPYKNVVPGGSYSSGKWYGNTGDYYPLGYNPYIGSTAQVGRNGTTAPLGSLFFNSGLGYTFTVVNEHGITSHNPTGSPLGSTAAWWDNGASGSNKETALDPSHIRGLALWLKPENIGVCGARVNGVSTDVWRDASPRQNHAVPPTWDRINYPVEYFKQTTALDAATGWSSTEGFGSGPYTNYTATHGHTAPDGSLTATRIVRLAGSSGDGLMYAKYMSFVTGRKYRYSIMMRLGESFPSDTINLGNVYGPRVYNGTSPGYGSPYSTALVSKNYWTKVEVEFTATNSANATLRAFEHGHVDIYGTGTGINNYVDMYVWAPTVEDITFVGYGITVDKLRPVLSVGSLAGPTGVCFNGGVLYAPTTVWNGASLAQWIQLGNTHGAGTTAERILTGQHLYLTNPLNLPDEADIFVVMRPTVDGYDKGLGLFSSDAGLTAYRRDDTVLYHRSYNPVDRNTALANSTYYRVLPNGSLLYPSVAPSGLVGFRPSGSKTGVQQNTIAYDPHVSGVCFGVAVGEWRRDSSQKIESFLNGDGSKNYSVSSGRRIAAVNTPSSDDYTITNGLVMHVDAANTASYSGSGTIVNDLSGNGKNGSLINMDSSNYSTLNGGFFTFNGVDERIRFGTGNDFFPLYDFTMDMWFRCDGTTPTTGTFPGLFGWTYGMQLIVYSNFLRMGLDEISSFRYLSSPTTYSFYNSSWHNVTVLANANTLSMYIDGNPAGSVATTWSGTTRYAGNDANIGRDNNNSTNFFRGAISTFKIYNRVLSASEIQQNFNVLRGRYGL